MSRRLRAHPLRGLLCGAMAAALMAVLLVTVVAHSDRADAGTTGAPYGVYVSAGNNVDVLPVTNLAAPPGTFNFGAQAFGATAINSTATLGVTFSDDYQDVPQVLIYSIPGNQILGSIRLNGIVGLAMDPADPNTAFALSSFGSVYRLSLNVGVGSPAPAPIANLNPTGSAYSCTSLAITPDGSQVVAGCTVGVFVHLERVMTGTGAVVDWSSGAFRDYTLTDLTIAPNGLTVFAVVASGSGFFNRSEVFSLPLFPAFIPSTAAHAVTPGGINPISYATSMTINRTGQDVFITGVQSAAGALGGNGFVVDVSVASGAVVRQAGLSQLVQNANQAGGPVSVAESPDEGNIVVVGGSSSAVTDVYAIPLKTFVPGPAVVLGKGDPSPDAQDIAVTPDQAAVANLAPASGTAGIPVTLSAALSNIAYGSITNFAWNFGDGQTASTGSPTVSHVFASAGNYNVTVTETDSAGGSVPPAPFVGGGVNGPGTTPYVRADPSARASAPVAIGPPGQPPPPPPTTTTSVPGSTPTTTTPTFHPTITLAPTVGSPGTIVTVTGQGFPPSSSVTVAWSPGSGSFTETTDASGNLAAQQLFILTPDLLGQRAANATVQGNAATATAPFLVVPGTAKPGGSGDVLFRSEGP